jgi:hypothetical protein
MILAAFLAAHENWQSLAFLIFPALQLAMQVIMWDPANPAKSLIVFRMNRDFGFLVLLAAAL